MSGTPLPASHQNCGNAALQRDAAFPGQHSAPGSSRGNTGGQSVYTAEDGGYVSLIDFRAKASSGEAEWAYRAHESESDGLQCVWCKEEC
jgi:hypothetical protein